MASSPKYRLSRLADHDLANIAEYTIQEFGIEQARRYRDTLEKCFLTLVETQISVEMPKNLQRG